jgi:hypothetical protein
MSWSSSGRDRTPPAHVVAVMSPLQPPWACCCTRPGRQGGVVGSRAVDVQVRRPAGPRRAMSRLGFFLRSVDAFHLSDVPCESVAASAGRNLCIFARPSGRSKLVVWPPRAGAGLGAQKGGNGESLQGARGGVGMPWAAVGRPLSHCAPGLRHPLTSSLTHTQHRASGEQVLRGPARTGAHVGALVREQEGAPVDAYREVNARRGLRGAGGGGVL